MNKEMKTISVDFKTRDKTLSFFGQNQYKDWKILLTIFFVSFLCAVLFALFSFFWPENEVDLFNNSNAVGNKKINNEVLTSMLDRMEKRQENLDSLKLSKPVVGDPGV
jgi:hypothetical protein